MIANRRKYHRIGSDGSSTIKLAFGEATGPVINESIAGLRIGGLDLLLLFENQKVVIDYKDQTTIGHCRSITRDENGFFQVGICREESASEPASNAILVNSYVNFGGQNIVCIPLEVVDENQVRVRLVNGKEFTVGRSQVTQLTRFERKQELEDESGFAELKVIYETVAGTCQFETADEMLDHEFGPVA